MSIFLEKFHKATEHRFEFIKLSAVTVYVRKKTIELTVLYPESLLTLSDSDRREIEQAAVQALNSDAAVAVRFMKSHFDTEFAAKETADFFKAYPMVASTVSESDIECGCQNGEKQVIVRLNPVAYRYCIERNVREELQKLFDLRYCDPVACSFIQKEEMMNEEEYEGPVSAQTALTLENPGGRVITPQNVDAFIGSPIYEKAVYISDALYPRESLTVCGTLTRLSDFTFAKKDGKEGTGWRLTIEDYTGVMECVHFPSPKNKEKSGLLKQGKQLVVRGSLTLGKKEGTMSFKINDISFCTLPEDFVPNRLIRPIDTHYRTVFPEPYQEAAQVSLFDAAAESIPVAMQEKTFVVFDTETTGVNPTADAVIEIGAVKIENGKLTEVFSALIDPDRPIPEGATKVNGITDQMVAGKPKIDEVLPDFYKFCDGALLAAHNIQFDAAFVGAAGKPLGIYFDHEKFDTLQLARKYIPNLRAYNLGALCEQLGIELVDAHRASADAAATAKLLIEIFRIKENAGR